jgi:hypothetical protein
MKPAVTWRTRLRSTSIRTTDSMKKMCIMSGYSPVDSNPRLRQHQQRHRLQRQRLRRRLRLHLHLLPLQRQDLLLLQDPFPRQGGDQLRGRDPELPAIGDRATALSKVDRLLRRRKYQAAKPPHGCGTNALRTTRSTVQRLPAVRKQNFRFNPVTKSSAQTSRQGCCSE